MRTEHVLPVEVMGRTVLWEFDEHGTLNRVSFQVCLNGLGCTDVSDYHSTPPGAEECGVRDCRYRASDDASRPTTQTYSSLPLRHNSTARGTMTSRAGESEKRTGQTQPSADRFPDLGDPFDEHTQIMQFTEGRMRETNLKASNVMRGKPEPRSCKRQ